MKKTLKAVLLCILLSMTAFAQKEEPVDEAVEAVIEKFSGNYVVKQGDTLSVILAQSFNGEEINNIARELKTQEPSYILRTGMLVNIDGETDCYTIQLAVDKDAVISKTEGAVNVAIQTYEAEILPTVVSGTITSSLFEAVATIGEDADLAAQLARMYEWEFDFFRDIRVGDSFSVLLEKKFVNGRYIGYGRILAADFVVQGKHHKAFLYSDGQRSGYYDEKAQALERGFLRVPLSYARITSRFTNNRFHPVLGINRPHYGVDYAAPTGTPVMVTASGTIEARSYTKANGKYVKVRHGNGYVTYYLHLNGFASGQRVGSAVTQGQVIGYVGSTGYSTGPHLDYRIQHNGQWINPLTFIAESPKLTAEHVDGFLEMAASREQTLNQSYQYAGHVKPGLLP